MLELPGAKALEFSAEFGETTVDIAPGPTQCRHCQVPANTRCRLCDWTFRQEAWGDVTACPTCQIRHFWSIGD